MGFSVEEDVKELRAKVIILEGQVAAMAPMLDRLNDMISQKQAIDPPRRWLVDGEDERGLS